jgi:hypothetical protein
LMKILPAMPSNTDERTGGKFLNPRGLVAPKDDSNRLPTYRCYIKYLQLRKV